MLLTFEGWTVPPGFESDGCTLSPDRPLGIDFTPACILHDFLRRHICHYDMKPSEADAIFRRHMKALGAPSWLATIYWVGVKVMRPWFRATRPLPVNWLPYGRQVTE